MNRENLPRRFAAWLLRFFHRLSPPPIQDWGEAMLSELEFVEGNWPALAWAAGGAGVLMKRSLIHFLTGRRESAATAGGPAHRDPVLGGGSMRKLSIVTATLAVSVLAVLLFAPSFRQALAITTHSWGQLVGSEPMSVAALRGMAGTARAEKDANTLAFVALALPPGAEGDQLTEEAVRLDSKLTWIYALRAAKRWPEYRSPQGEAWIAKVEAWDPTNGYARFLHAQQIALEDGLWWNAKDLQKYRSDPRWMGAMADAFACRRWDSYFSARMDLDRDVMTRRHLTDPMLAVYAVSQHPFPNIWLLQRYALAVLDAEPTSANSRAAVSTVGNASDAAWKIARYGQVMSLQSQTFLERFIGDWLQREAYKRLEKIAEKAGDRDQQAMFAYQIERLDPRRHAAENGLLIGLYQWNAAAGQVSIVVMLISGTLLIVGIAKLAFDRRAKSEGGVLSKGLRVSALAGGAGLLASSITLYVSYHPYAELFSRFARGSGGTGAGPLMTFWDFAEFARLSATALQGGLGWATLLVIAACLLVLEIYRVFSSRGPVQETV